MRYRDPLHRPLVSIVIPCWNGEQFIGEAIESALSQTYPDVEVIVIDDGSTDASLKVIKSFGNRVRWESGPNRGACGARNRGLQLARGGFIQFLDSDDLLKPQKMELQVPLSCARAEEIIYCDRESHLIGDPERKWVEKVSAGADPVVFALTKIISISTPLYPRGALLQVRGCREGLRCAQDYDLNLRLALAGWRYRRLPAVLVTVRRRSESISSDSLKVLQQMLDLWRETLRHLDRLGILTQGRRAAIAARIASAGRVHLRAGRVSDANRLFREARNIDPGGADMAYSTPTRIVRNIMGAIWAERLRRIRRSFNPSHRPG
jgi:glycosyltransferase involved in cell wall biosynthesis